MNLNTFDKSKLLLGFIKDYMKICRVSQKELALKIGMDEANLSRILQGKHMPSLNTLISIVDQLGLSLSLTYGNVYPLFIQ